MKRRFSWWVLLILAVVCYVLSYLIGGYISTVLNVLGLVFVIFGIIRMFPKKKDTK